MAFQNDAARRRRRAARRVYGYLQQLDLSLKVVSKATGIDMDTLRNLKVGTPKLETLDRISRYIEKVAREKEALSRAGVSKWHVPADSSL
jgi:hypothetical protein